MTSRATKHMMRSGMVITEYDYFSFDSVTLCYTPYANMLPTMFLVFFFLDSLHTSLPIFCVYFPQCVVSKVQTSYIVFMTILP